MMLDRLMERVGDMMQFGILASLGGLANYLYITVYQEKKFSFIMMLVNLFLAFYVGNVVGSFIPEENKYRDGLLLVCGFCTYPILSVVETQSKRFLTAILNRWIDKTFGSSNSVDRNKPED